MSDEGIDLGRTDSKDDLSIPAIKLKSYTNGCDLEATQSSWIHVQN